VRGLASDGHAADDLEQATWLAALQRPPRSSEGLRAWLARAARNLSFNRRRAEAHEALRRARAGAEPSWPPADEVVAELELAERVLAEVRALPEALRAAVHARYYEGLALEEIARRSGVPAATIKDRLERARSILRARLGRDIGGERGLGALVVFLRRALSSIAGGMLVKKVVALVAVVLVVVLAFRFFDARSENREAAPRAEALAAVSRATEPAPEIAPVIPSAERESIPVQEPPSVARPASQTGALRVAVTWPDGAPAERVFVRVWPAELGDLAGTYCGAATDAEGTTRFVELEPGSYRVQLEREKDFALADVRAGGETALALAVSSGPRAKGVVVDEHGEPVAGARVWISTRYATWTDPPLDDSPAAITGSDGRFEIPSVGKAWLIGASAEGYAPSKEESLTRFRSPEVEVRLVLPERGGAIEGRVLGPDGAPLEGAVIRADVGFRFERYPDGGMLILNSLRLQTRSSADGSFRFSGVQPGEVELSVESAGLGGWHAKVEVTAGATAHVEASLAAAGAVSGRIVAPDGTPLAGALVIASLESSSESFVPQAEWLDQDWSTFVEQTGTFTATRSGADGSYRLTGLAAGWSYVMAESLDAGRGVEPFVAVAGGEVHVDLELARGLELRCRVVDEQGAPLPDLPVFVGRTADAAHDVTYGLRGPFHTDADGRFAVPNCLDADYQLDVRHPRHDERSLEGRDDHGLRPGPSEHVIVVAYEDAPEAGVRGIVLDDGGRPLAGARVDLSYPSGGSDRIADSAPDGSFHADGLEPGTYGLWIRAPGFPYIGLAPRELAPGETLDLGTLQMKTPGFLDVRLRREDGERIDDELWHADLYWPDGSYWWSNFEIELGVAHSDPIAPGDYVLRIPGLPDRAVDVEAGVTRELEVVWPAEKK
jgi:RNA polymerase sigma-70 factor (ECF subfamily)